MKKPLLCALLLTMASVACSDDTPTDVPDPMLQQSLSQNDEVEDQSPFIHVYRVTVENWTSSQPFSPGVAVTHNRSVRLFQNGESAREGLRLIAENGDPSTAASMLDGRRGVDDVVATAAPVGCVGCPGPFGSSLTFDIEAGPSASRLSLALMLICTNDGFVGLNSVKLPKGFGPETYIAEAYDAGTEANDELFTSIVDPCGGIGPVSAPPDGMNNRTATDDGVSHHPGIAGVGDLDAAAHGWDRVAKVTIQRLRPRYRVTVENMTPSQPLSPGVAVTHRMGLVKLVNGGLSASEGLRFIAENGDPSVAVSELDGLRGVRDVVATTAPVGCVGCPGPFASSLSFEIEATAKARRLSLALMLICTNDGFAGLGAVKLPGGFSPATYYASAYDAGTEANDELYTSIVDPCGGIGPVAAAPDGMNNRTPTANTVAMHPGIAGVGDLDPNAHGWSGPVAKVTVERIRP